MHEELPTLRRECFCTVGDFPSEDCHTLAKLVSLDVVADYEPELCKALTDIAGA